MPKKWIFPAPLADAGRIAAVADGLGVSQPIAALLATRGYDTAEAMDRYLSPGLRHLMRPAEIPGLEAAVGTDPGRVQCIENARGIEGIEGAGAVLFHRRRCLSAAGNPACCLQSVIVHRGARRRACRCDSPRRRITRAASWSGWR